MMLRTRIYKCEHCGSIVVTTVNAMTMPFCNKCKVVMKELQDDFDLAEIVDDYDACNKGRKNNEHFRS